MKSFLILNGVASAQQHSHVIDDDDQVTLIQLKNHIENIGAAALYQDPKASDGDVAAKMAAFTAATDAAKSTKAAADAAQEYYKGIKTFQTQ